MKKKIIIIVGVLVLLMGGLIIAPNLIDWNSFKPQVADGFEAATGQTVKLGGDLSFKLLPSPALRASNVSLANWPGGEAENFLEMEALDIRLELFPLLSGDVKITSLVVDGGKIYLERDLEGNANWETLFAGEEAAPEAAEASEVAMESFLLSATDIYYSDARAGFQDSVKNINADLIITSLSGPFTGTGDFEYRGVPVNFTFATGLFGEGANVPLRVGLVLGDDDPGLKFQGTFVQEASVTALSGNFNGGGENALSLITLFSEISGLEETPVGPWQTAYKIDTNLLLVLTQEKTDLVLDPLSLTLGATKVNGKIQFLSAKTIEAKAELAINTLNANDWMVDGGQEGRFEIPTYIKADIALDIDRLSYNGGEIRGAAFKGVLERGIISVENLAAVLPGNSDLRLTGTLESRSEKAFLNAKVHLDSRALRDLASWLEFDLSGFPSNRVTRLTFDGQIRLADPALEILRATISLDSTRFAGGVTLDLDDPSLFAVAGTINTLDLDTYFPDLLQKTEHENLTAQINSIQEGLTGLAGYNGIIDLKVGRLKMMGANLRDITFSGGLAGNDLEIMTLEVGSFEGAKLSLSGSIRDIPGQMFYTLSTSLSAETFKPLMTWAETESPFDERVVPAGAISAQLGGNKNRSQYDLSGNLSGIAFSLKGSAENLMGEPVIAADLGLSHDRMIEFVRKFSPEYFPAKTPLGAFKLEASLKGDDGDLRIENLALQMGPARLKGNLRYRTQNERPNITGSLSTGRIRLDDFMAPVEAGIEEVTEGGKRWSSDVWDTTFLRENDFNISFEAPAVGFRTYSFINPKVRLFGQGGVLTIENLNAGFYGGRLSVNATMDATDVPVLDITMDLNGVATRDVLESSADITRLTGTLDFSGTFQGRGSSQQAVINTLSGNATLSTTNGVISGINMPRLSEQMGTLNNLAAFTSLLGRVFEGGETSYRYIRTSAEISSGKISFDQIDSDVDATEVGGRGNIDLPAWNMDISGALRMKDHATVPAIGFSMKGRVDDPEVKYDYAALQTHMTNQFATTLFENLLGIPETEEPLEEGGGSGLEGEVPEEEAEPTPEEQLIKGLFDLFGGQDEEEEGEGEGEEEDDEGGGIN
ncbi:MAG: AsmA family protein [Alphaproteobacteria bacterium]